jgi:hypothetical protein
MDYQKSGIIVFKRLNNKIYFLLGKNNLNLLNDSDDVFSDIGGVKGVHDSNSKDTAVRTFYENTFGLIGSMSDLKYKITNTFTNDKYKQIFHFIENNNISDEDINKINKVRSYINSTIKCNGLNTYEKKNIQCKDCIINNDIKWFELNEIISDHSNFDSKFLNSFLKYLKLHILSK